MKNDSIESKLAQRALIEALTAVYRQKGGRITSYKMGETNPDATVGFFGQRHARDKKKRKNRLAKEHA